MNYLKIFVLMFAFPSLLFSQGAYLDKGQNGIGVLGHFSSNKDASTFGGSAGFSASGVFDFGISVSKTSFVQKLNGEDLSATGVSPFVTFHAIKQDETTPISLSFSASYLSASYSSTALDNLKLTMGITGYSIGASIYGNINSTPTFKIQPTTGVSYGSTKLELKDSYGNSQTIDNNLTIFNVGFALLFQTNPKTIFGIEPSINIDKDNTYFGIQTGFVFIL